MKMSNSDLKKAITAFVNHNFLMNSKSIHFNDSDSFIERSIIDSTGVLEMVSFIQEKFGIVIEDTELIPENLDSVNNIATFIQRKQLEK